MARISGVTLPANKRIEVALTSIYGIGLFASKKILKLTKISPDTRTKDLTSVQVNLLHGVIEKQHKVEGDLKREVMMNIKRLKEIGCCRGVRHIKHLPVRGQKTKTNSRTVRGNVRQTALSGRKPTAEKT
ncbi:MAG: 30S ribosomal protein S13 [bacterium]